MSEPVFELSDRIRVTSLELHRFLKHGHLEKVYENGLAHRLRKLGLKVEQQFPLTVRDEDGTVLGQYLADLFVEDMLIVELKACPIPILTCAFCASLRLGFEVINA